MKPNGNYSLSNFTETDLIEAYMFSKPSISCKILLANPKLFNKTHEKVNASILFRAVLEENIKLVNFLLSKGVNPNITNNIGETPLHHAADNSLLEIATNLIHYSADPNSETIDGETPLHNAAFRGDKNMVELLLLCSSDPNKKNNFLGRTPLHYAAECNSADCIKLLLESFADKSIKDNDGNSPYDLAFNAKIKELLEIDDKIKKENHTKINSLAETDLSSIIKESPNLIPDQVDGSDSEEMQLTTQSSLNKLYDFLSRHNLQEYFEVLQNAGYDDLELIYQKTRGNSPINEVILENIGIEKAGHRIRLIMALEENCYRNQKLNDDYRDNKMNEEICISVQEWLNIIKLSFLAENFIKAGYDDMGFLIKQMRSKYQLGHKELENIGVDKFGYRLRILGKLYEESDVMQETIRCDEKVCKSRCALM
ncbi:unnamed protein product [Blepharisma stoltei]|uniref:SAM domain-containing protein n=1 Tax=Blepharisma stoltei TaxID=1481888 RepID=A0AAU9KB75_9CILI|nr:unnamed protein product [Blepharisma stoltei]